MKYTTAVFILYALFICIHINCTMSGDISGTGSQAGNGNVLGKVVNPDGSPAVNVDVFIRPKGFLKDTTEISGTTVPDGVTDSTGAFLIDTVEPGEYFVEINDCIQNAILVDWAIRQAINSGVKTFGLGSSSPDDKALRFFKANWGSVESNIKYHYWNHIPRNIDLQSSFLFLRQIYSYLPLAILKRIPKFLVPKLV